MAAQTATLAGSITAIVKGFFSRAENQQLLNTMQADLVALRNTVDAMVTVFNAHTHKTPTSNPGATSTPTSDAGGSGSTGGTASAQVTAANIVTTQT